MLTPAVSFNAFCNRLWKSEFGGESPAVSVVFCRNSIDPLRRDDLCWVGASCVAPDLASVLGIQGFANQGFAVGSSPFEPPHQRQCERASLQLV